MKNSYYVYIYINPDTKIPFYVGKGTGKRMFQHLKSKKQCASVDLWNEIQSIRRMYGVEPLIEKVMDNMCENDALNFETQLIILFGRRRFDNNGVLVNIFKKLHPDGNYRETKEYIKLCSQNTKNLWKSKEYRTNVLNGKMKSNFKYREFIIEKWKDEEFREKMLKKFRSPKCRENQREHMLKLWECDKFRDKILEQRNTREYKENVSRWSKDLWNNEEYRNARKKDGEERSKILSKTYKITFLNGNTLIVKGIKKWCSKNGYNYSMVNRLMKNLQKKGKYRDIIKVEELMPT